MMLLIHPFGEDATPPLKIKKGHIREGLVYNYGAI